MSAAVSPVPRLTFFDNAGAPLNGGLVYTYAAGTTTPKLTYSNEALSTPISNPIVLNSAGRPQASATDPTEVNVYLLASSYKFVVKTSGGVTLYTADNVEANAPNPITLTFPLTVSGVTSGGVIYASSTTVLASSALLASNALLLGGGAATAPLTDSNWVIEQTGHTLASATQPRVTVMNSGLQSIPNAAETALTYDTNIVAVPSSMHSTSASTSHLVVPAGAGGFYLFTATAYFVSNATGQRYVYLLKNGATAVSGVATCASNSAANGTGLSVTGAAVLAAGDYVEVMVYQNSGGALNVGGVGLAFGGVYALLTKLW